MGDADPTGLDMDTGAYCKVYEAVPQKKGNETKVYGLGQEHGVYGLGQQDPTEVPTVKPSTKPTDLNKAVHPMNNSKSVLQVVQRD